MVGFALMVASIREGKGPMLSCPFCSLVPLVVLQYVQQGHGKDWKEAERCRQEGSRGLPARLPHQLATTPNHCKQNKVTHSILFKFCISSRTAAIFIRPRSPILLWPKLQKGEKKKAVL